MWMIATLKYNSYLQWFKICGEIFHAKLPFAWIHLLKLLDFICESLQNNSKCDLTFCPPNQCGAANNVQK